jgi:hypothetical protein
MAIEIIIKNPEPSPIAKFLAIVGFFGAAVVLLHACGF